MTLHLGFNSGQRSSEQAQEIREAKRLLKEQVKDDWEYPPLPAYQLPVRKRKAEESTETNGEVIAGFRFQSPSNHERDALVGERGLGFEPLEWRERDYSSEEDSGDESGSVKTISSGGSKKSTYKFDGPDSVGAQLSQRKEAKKRKRQAALDEEVVWNEGLAHWLARRDAWSGAHTSQQIQLLEKDHRSDSQSPTSTPRSSTSTTTTTSHAPSTPASTSTPSTTPDLNPQPLITTRPPAPPSNLLVPLTPPFLPTHPIRKRITPDIYPEIYTKIILQGRTPSVPINLSSLTRALVQGWKDDGEWPPKPSIVERSIGRKRGTGESSLKSGVRAVGRVLRITGSESREKG